MINVGLIPLDSRPCNTTWVEDIARIGHLKVTMYPREKCGNLFQGAKLDEIIKWLEVEAPNIDYLIISSDGLCFGGLIQARLAQINLDETIVKLQILKEIKSKFPKMKIYVFDTMMRTSITAIDKETSKYWASMNKFSLLKGRCHFFHEEDDIKELAALEEEIPHHIIDTYLKARETKFSLNKLFLEFVNNQIIDSMILLQEDSMPYGIQQIEQLVLEDYIKENSLENKVHFYNGTDEGAVVLLGKILLEINNKKLKLFLHTPNYKVIDKVFLFEDRKFTINLEKMMQSIGLEFTNDITQSDFVLSIYGIEGNYGLELDRYYEVLPINDDDYKRFVNSLNQFLNEGKKVVLVDLLFPNGGSPVLLNDVDYRRLTVYSAWNTASNSLGSALGQIVAYMMNGDQELNKKFMYERVIDDCIYQYIVRRKVSEKLVKEGINIFALNKDSDYALSLVKEGLQEFKSYIDDKDFEVTLPWHRMFEAEILIKK